MHVGQRWRWVFNDGDDKSDLIVEITRMDDMSCDKQIVQVISSTFREDRIGKTFESEPRFDLRKQGFSTYEYLEGQDKPQPNIDWNSEIVFSQVAPDGTLNVITNVTLPYPVEYISMTLKI